MLQSPYLSVRFLQGQFEQLKTSNPLLTVAHLTRPCFWLFLLQYLEERPPNTQHVLICRTSIYTCGIYEHLPGCCRKIPLIEMYLVFPNTGY